MEGEVEDPDVHVKNGTRVETYSKDSSLRCSDATVESTKKAAGDYCLRCEYGVGKRIETDTLHMVSIPTSE